MALLTLVLAGCAGASSPSSAAPAPAYRPPSPTAAAPAAAPLERCERTPQAAPVTQGLPELSLSCLGPGPEVNLAALRGRPTVVNLWATWCAPCREEMPALQRTHERLGGKVRFLGVNTKDDPDGARAFLAATGSRYPQVLDPDGELLQHLQMPGLPVTVILDSRGTVVHRKIGKLGEGELDALLATLD